MCDKRSQGGWEGVHNGWKVGAFEVEVDSVCLVQDEHVKVDRSAGCGVCV